MHCTSVISLLLSIAVFTSAVNAFYLYLPRNYEPIEDQLILFDQSQLIPIGQLTQDQLQKRTTKSSIRRRSADCRCNFKVCTMHCLS